MLGKKGDVMLVTILILIILVIIIMFVDNFALRGCRRDSECGDNSYCGVDKECHTHPVIEREIIKERVAQDLLFPSVILGLALIIAAVIYKWKVN